MKVLISGAGGSIGKELTRHLSTRHDVLALTRNELEITNQQMVRRLISSEHPELIINCAVLGVDECENDPAMAWAVNVSGPQTLAASAAEVGAEIVHFSSNYVFDGKRRAGSFYTINDAPSPINVYGETKLAGERAVGEACARAFIVRTSWVFGSGKENFFTTACHRLMAAKPLRAVTDMWANTTYVADLIDRLDEILTRRHHATYHIVSEGVCSYYEFALEASRILGMTSAETDQLIEARSESAMERRAERPRYTPMRCLVSEKLGLAPMRNWRAALAEYLLETQQCSAVSE
jgi:dTDP-4-dehydrorhamnose reductase